MRYAGRRGAGRCELDDDLALIEALIGGDVSAAREFVGRYGPVAFNVFRNHFGLDGSTAEDLFQQVFEKLADHGFCRLRGFRGESSFRTWFTVVCRNTAYDHLRAVRHGGHGAGDPDDGSTDQVDALPGGQDTCAQVFAAELRSRLGEALGMLPERYREVLELCYRDDLDYREIAERTGDSISNVGVKLSRARAMLKRVIESRFPELPLHLDGE